MIIEVRGWNFVNKGSELMAQSIIQQISNWDEECILAANLRIGNFQQRRNLGFHHLTWIDLIRFPQIAKVISQFVDRFAQRIPRIVREKGRVVTSPEISAVFDMSGFAFSDQWGIAHAQALAGNSERWKGEGKKLILLPQAFGPFTSSPIKNAMKTVLKNADLIFARDQISYDHLIRIDGQKSNIEISPDFTSISKGCISDDTHDYLGKPCIIPNARMLDKTDTAVGNWYTEFLITCIDYLWQRGLEPFILLHENNDYGLTQYLQIRLEREIQIVFESNPLYLKGLIGACPMVISSRYHGLVSALSQSIPCMGAGWSHKYEMLFRDYRNVEFLVEVDSTKEMIRSKIDKLINEKSREEIISRLDAASVVQNDLVLQMWARIKAVLFG